MIVLRRIAAFLPVRPRFSAVTARLASRVRVTPGAALAMLGP
jgi:hypothetical protein